MDKAPSLPCAQVLVQAEAAGLAALLLTQDPIHRQLSGDYAAQERAASAYHWSPCWRRCDTHLLVLDKHLLGSHPPRNPAQKLPGIWAGSQDPPTATDTCQPPFLPSPSHGPTCCPRAGWAHVPDSLFSLTILLLGMPLLPDVSYAGYLPHFAEMPSLPTPTHFVSKPSLADLPLLPVWRVMPAPALHY